MVAVVVISLIIFLVLFFYFITKENSNLSKLKKEYKSLNFESVKSALINLRRDGISIDEKFINDVALYFGVKKESIIENNNSEILETSITKMRVGDMLIESGNHYKKAVNSIFYCLFIELILAFILYLASSVEDNTPEANGYKLAILVVIILVALMFFVYYLINKYSAANYLKKAGEGLNLKN